MTAPRWCIASFACRMCLAAPDLITLAGGPGERRATSTLSLLRRRSTGSTMSDAQAFQLWTLQRGNTFVHFAPEYW